MNFISIASGCPASDVSARAALFGALLLFAGCAGGDRPAVTGTVPASRTAVQQDSLGQFVANAAPGQETTVTLADGRPARVQLLRAYAAASGRECREVLVGGSAGRATLLCESEGQWVASRPLLGGGAARP